MSDKKRKGRPGRPPLGATPKDRAEDRHVSPRESFHMPAELHSVLVAYNVSSRIPKSAIIVTALEKHFADLGLWPPKRNA